MTETQPHSPSSGPEALSRRSFIKLAALAGLLARCGPTQQAASTAPPQPTHTAVPTHTSTPAPSPTPAPTTTLTPPPTRTPSPTATPAATATPAPTITPASATGRPDIIKAYPDGPSRVVHAHHAGVWDGENLVPGAIGEMLDASITELTGLNDAHEAWAALFDPGERVAIKVNAFRNSLIWTHVPLVTAVTERLQAAGVPAEQIVIFDFYTSELDTAGFAVNPDGPGVRCDGTDGRYTGGWQIVDTDVQLSDVLLSCQALINMPILKDHSITGISFALKNHYGSIPFPAVYHQGERKNRGLPELNALPPIRDRTRLIIGDILAASLQIKGTFPYWVEDWRGDSILMSFDPVAHDAVGLEYFSQLLTADGRDPAQARGMSNRWLENGADLNLGTNSADQIDLVEVSLG